MLKNYNIIKVLLKKKYNQYNIMSLIKNYNLQLEICKKI